MFLFGKKYLQKAVCNIMIVCLKNFFILAKIEGNIAKIKVDLVKNLKFEDKEKWFKTQTDRIRIPWTYGADYLHISEHNLIESTLQGIKKINLHKVSKLDLFE